MVKGGSNLSNLKEENEEIIVEKYLSLLKKMRGIQIYRWAHEINVPQKSGKNPKESCK